MVGMGEIGRKAAALLDEHMNETTAPHYFYSLLGDLSADNPETALEWHRLAFERSNHGSARIKWGTAYVLKLIQLAPDDADAIGAAARELIAELVDQGIECSGPPGFSQVDMRRNSSG